MTSAWSGAQGHCRAGEQKLRRCRGPTDAVGKIIREAAGCSAIAIL
jgi:hypothetical protein